MASGIYCSNVAEELESWSEKLHKLSGDIANIPSIDKYRLLPQIEQLHIIMTEMDDRLCELVNACAVVGTGSSEKEVGGPDMTPASGKEKFDYEVGG